MKKFNEVLIKEKKLFRKTNVGVIMQAEQVWESLVAESVERPIWPQIKTSFHFEIISNP
ncbi:hypothetical protein ACQKMD_04990 [Viridibacillus sp. NPDC096237]|uniref:hypothetical protein n=1 Tax=Viridibacillus sp. NPDC096237 TaxID=3390721 RepID=UPI003D065C26